MPALSPAKKRDVKLIHLLPNILTLSAICAGLTAIRYGFHGEFERAVGLILLACILDGIDGRLARLLKCPTPIGAELDSLADFLNFGVTPALVIYSWALTDFQRLGWIAALAYAVCCVLRLARFNVSNRQEDPSEKSETFTGVPSPAGAVLVMLPMFVSFAMPEPSTPHALGVAVYLLAIGFLMISRIPTYAFKNITVDRENAKYWLLGAVLIAGAFLTFFWATLVVLTLAYGATLVWAFKSFYKSRNSKG
ncbi:MAG: CDP-diacylglycerol--serine O-phosphatidyltransferase [Marinosulfonomonas sp.]